MIMGKLGDYEFTMSAKEYRKIQDTTTAEFKTIDSANGIERLMGTPLVKREIELNGIQVLQSLDNLKDIQADLRIGEITRLTTVDDDISCVITYLKNTKSSFTDDGSATVQEFNIKLKEVLEELR